MGARHQDLHQTLQAAGARECGFLSGRRGPFPAAGSLTYCRSAAVVARPRRLPGGHGDGGRISRGGGAPAVPTPLAAPIPTSVRAGAGGRVPPTPAAAARGHAARRPHLRPREAGTVPQAATGRPVAQLAGGASGRRPPAARLLRPQAGVVRPGAVGSPLPHAAGARGGGTRGGLPPAVPAVRVGWRRRLPGGVSRHGVQRPAHEPAAGAAEAVGGSRGGRRAPSARPALASSPTLAAGRGRRRHAAPVLVNLANLYIIKDTTPTVFAHFLVIAEQNCARKIRDG